MSGESPKRTWLVVAAVAAGGWLTALAGLAFATGNKPLVSERQLDRATLVVAAENAGGGAWRVVEVLKGTPPESDTLRVLEGPDASRAVLPLSPAGGGRFEVTPVPVEGVEDRAAVARPVYSDTNAVRRAVRQIGPPTQTAPPS